MVEVIQGLQELKNKGTTVKSNPIEPCTSTLESIKSVLHTQTKCLS